MPVKLPSMARTCICGSERCLFSRSKETVGVAFFLQSKGLEPTHRIQKRDHDEHSAVGRSCNHPRHSSLATCSTGASTATRSPLRDRKSVV